MSESRGDRQTCIFVSTAVVEDCGLRDLELMQGGEGVSSVSTIAKEQHDVLLIRLIVNCQMK